MVDAEDLKSFGHCDRVGSSPTNPTKIIGCVAQLVRALRSHRRGRRFESAHIHHKKLNRQNADFIFLFGNVGREPRGSKQAHNVCAVKGAHYDTMWHNGNYNPPTSTTKS